TAETGAARSRQVARIVLQHWVRIRSAPTAPVLARDRLAEQVHGTPQAMEWTELVAQIALLDRMKALLLPVLSGDANAGRVWGVGEQTRFARRGAGPRGRLVDMVALLPEAGEALEPIAREVLSEALDVVEFPDPSLSALAGAFAAVGGS